MMKLNLRTKKTGDVVSMSNNVQHHIAWIDVETTGKTSENNKLIQVACLITDLELNLVDEKGYSADIRHSEDEVDWILRNADNHVINMHNKTGLWDRLPSGTPLKQAEVELLDYLHQHTYEDAAYLGGNSITLDRNFLNYHMPKVGAWLNYRSIDVSSIAILAEEWFNGLVFDKKYNHDAIDDIRESLNQLKFFRKTAFLPSE